MNTIEVPIRIDNEQAQEIIDEVSKIVDTTLSKDYYTNLRNEIAVRFYFDKHNTMEGAINNANRFISILKTAKL